LFCDFSPIPIFRFQNISYVSLLKTVFPYFSLWNLHQKNIKRWLFYIWT
jgi:hypothetical protein